MLGQDNPFADLIPQKPPSAPSQQGMFIPARQKQPTALELRREARADEDQQLQRDAALRANATAERAVAATERQIANDERRTSRENLATQTDLRKEFNGLPHVKEFNDVRASRQQIRSLALKDNATAQDDIAIIFSYMKMLDPGSVVREGEFATAQNAAGIPTAIANMYNKALDGTRLTREQRLNMAQTAENLYQTRRESYNATATQYRDMAEAQGMSPGLVARRYVPDSENPAFQNSAAPIAKEQQALSISSLTDLATGLSGGDYTPTPDGGLSYNGEPVSASAEVLNSDQYREAYRAKFGEYPPVQVDVAGGGEAPPDPRMAGRENAILDPLIRGAADTLTLGGADEISAAAQTIFGNGTMRENLRRERAIDAFDEQNNPVPRIAGQIAGGLGLPTGGVTSARGLAGIGAGYAAGYGFGSSDGSFSDRLLNAGLSAPVGAAGGYVGGRVADYLGGRVPPPGPQRGSDVAQAALDQGVDIVRPDAQPNLRGFYSFAESMPIAGGRVRADLQRGNDQMAQRLIDVGGGFQTPRPAAGEAIRGGAERYIARSRDVVNRGYERARAEAGNATATPTNAVSNLNAQIAELNVTPEANAAKLNVLTRLRADMVDASGNPRALPVDAVRNLRTAMRDELNASGLRFSDAERRVMAVLDEAGQDIANGLTGRARRAYDRADRLYRERAEMVDDVVRRFVGRRDAPTSSEKIMGVVDNMAAPRSGDERRLGRMMQVLQPAERQMVASSIAGVLGRGGDQAADFSAQRFFTEIKKYSPEAREAIFGQQGSRDIQQLATIAEARQGTLARLNNSGSGRVSNWMQAITSVLSGGGLGGVVGAATGAGASVGGGVGMAAAPAVLGGVYLRARALGNPRFIAALAAGANARNPQQQRQAVSRLTQIANREPALAADVLPIRDFLAQAIEASPGRLAASENEHRRRPEVPQDHRP